MTSAKNKTIKSQSADSSSSRSKDFDPPTHVVGIGSSAGGLEALDDFLKNVPINSGLAFVIVQHMDPTHKGMMAELLQRATHLPLIEITNKMKVERDHIYLIPPGRDLALIQGELSLTDPTEARGFRLPIDFFFHSLATDQKQRSIGVILSGMGADGTLGLKAIKKQGGLCFAQLPSTAKFDAMPQSAIATGCVDGIASAGDLPDKILVLTSFLPIIPNIELELIDNDPLAIETIISLLQQSISHDFSQYKKSTINRRIERRMIVHQVNSISKYLELLKKEPAELEQLFKEFLIGVTSFFRDMDVWKQLKDVIFPKIFDNYPSGAILRAWVPGCSTGEEAYSLAMVFKEAIEKLPSSQTFSLQIFATDLDKFAIEKARIATYSPGIANEIPHERLTRFFTEDGEGYRLNKEIREMVIFAQQNLIMDPPFTKLDILSCRNLLIYFNATLQKRLIPLFYYSLKTGGILLLGSSETIGSSTDLFAPQPSPGRFYQKMALGQHSEIEFSKIYSYFGASPLDHTKTPKSLALTANIPNIENLASHLLLQNYAPAAVLVTDVGEILFISGRTGKYLEPSSGKANWSLFSLARDGLNLALNESFFRAIREKKSITITDIKVGTENDSYIVDVTVQPIYEPEGLRGLILVVFADKGKSLNDTTAQNIENTEVVDPQIKDLTSKLQSAQESLRINRQEMQTSQEELKSTNEELQSTNEELQSINEELTTSKEEIQSMNEELQTVNHELQAKVDELSHTSNDMKNLLNSTDIATLFLDEKLNIRRFTAQAAGVIKLIASDAGRPITDLANSLDYPMLAEDTQRVLKTLIFIEKQIASNDGRWYTVRIMPYRTNDNRIDGVVITFVNISSAKQLESQLRNSQMALSHAFDQSPMGMAILADVDRWIQVNQSLCTLLGYSEAELLAVNSSSLIDKNEQELYRSLIQDLLASKLPSKIIRLRCLHKEGHAVPVEIRASLIQSPTEKSNSLLLQIHSRAD